MKVQGFIGPAYQLESVNADYQRAVNLYPEIIESKYGKGQQVGYYKSTPGLDEILDDGSGPIRLTHYDQFGRIFIVSADEVYYAGKYSASTFASSDVNTGTDEITEANHDYRSGVRGQLTTTGTLPTGLSLATDYYIIEIDKDTYQFATSWANTKTATQVIITGAGSGNHTFTPIANSAGYQSQLLGTLNTSTGVVKAASSNTSFGATLFVDGGDIYMFWDAGSSISFGELSLFGYTVPTDPASIIWIDGYFITYTIKSGIFQVSELNSFNFGALDFASSEGDPDNIIGIEKLNRDLYVFNERTTEIFVNTGNPDFPFERVQGGFIETGCISLASISRGGGVIFFLGRDEFGSGIVHMIGGSQTKRISTHAIEQKISSYASPESATSYCYQSKGHTFYVLNFAEATWVYDLASGLWHERAYTNAGTLERQRPDVCTFYQKQNVHILGDYATSKVYAYNDSTYTDNGDAITRLRSTPHISNENYRLFCSRLWLDMETGIGLVSGQGSDPQVMLRWSDDGGHTWSDESWTSAGGQTGGIGEYKTRVFWNRLGKFRDRIFEFKITDPVPITLIDASIDVRKGRN